MISQPTTTLRIQPQRVAASGCLQPEGSPVSVAVVQTRPPLKERTGAPGPPAARWVRCDLGMLDPAAFAALTGRYVQARIEERSATGKRLRVTEDYRIIACIRTTVGSPLVEMELDALDVG
jgi:hypothetical protein